MDVSSVFFVDLVKKFNRLILPNYQRKYCWKKEHWERLLVSLQQSTEHYIGRVYVAYIEKSNDVYVIDGQQRLTTIFILLSVLRNIFSERISNGDKNEFLKKFLGDIEEVLFIGEKNEKKSVKFLPTPKDQPPFFCAFFRNFSSVSNDIKGSSIWECFQFFEESLHGSYKDQVVGLCRSIMRLKTVLIILRERTRLCTKLSSTVTKAKFEYRSVQEMYKEIFDYSQRQALFNPTPGVKQNAYDLVRNQMMMVLKFHKKDDEFDVKYFGVFEEKIQPELRDPFLMWYLDQAEQGGINNVKSMMENEKNQQLQKLFEKMRFQVNLYTRFLKFQAQQNWATVEDYEMFMKDFIQKANLFLKIMKKD